MVTIEATPGCEESEQPAKRARVAAEDAFTAGIQYSPPLRYTVLSHTGLVLRAHCSLNSAEAGRVEQGAELLVAERRLEPTKARGASLMRLRLSSPLEGWTSELPKFVGLAAGQAAPERCGAASEEEVRRREGAFFNERGQDLRHVLDRDCCDCKVLRAGLDVARLRAELEEVERAHGFLDKVINYTTTGSSEGWGSIALRSIGGEEGQAASSNTGVQDARPFEDTATMRQCCPYIRQIIAEVGAANVYRVRITKLRAGGSIAPHRDYFSQPSVVRLHLPITTNDQVDFFIRGKNHSLEAGTVYFTNVRQEHKAANRSSSDRVHLVFDVEAPLALQDLLQAK